MARRLQHGVTGHGAILYLALYAPIWWAWVGFVLYTDRFGTDDLSDRIKTLLRTRRFAGAGWRSPWTLVIGSTPSG